MGRALGFGRVLPWIATVGLLWTPSASADWPMSRHDPGRTGRATGTSNIESPAAYWRAYLGGAIQETNFVIADVGGASAVIFISAGRVLAKRLSDSAVWETAPLGFQQILGFADLDNDGTDDLVARSEGQVYVLDVATGSILWEEPEDEMGTVGAVRIGDADGDGVSDLVIQECGCCALNSGNTGFVYSFASGYGSPAQLSSLPLASCGGFFVLTTFLGDGNGSREILMGQPTYLAVVNGDTGSVLAQTPVLGEWIHRSFCTPVNVDATGGEELLCIQNASQPPGVDQRRMFLLRYDTFGPITLTEDWRVILAPDAGNISYVNPVVDLDGDGDFEVVVSVQDAMGDWTTEIYDAATGTLLDGIADHIVAGIEQLDGTNPTIVTTSGSATFGFSFVAGMAGQLWTIDDRAPLTYTDHAKLAVSSMDKSLLVRDLDRDGSRELITYKLSAGAQLSAYSFTGGVAVEQATLVFDEGQDVLEVWPVTEWDGARLAVATNDGVLTLRDGNLDKVRSGDDVSANEIRVGGYYAEGRWSDLRRTPVVGSLGGSSDVVVVNDSANTLLRLDASDASMLIEPEVVWQRTNTFAPAIVSGLGDSGAPGIACLGIEEPITTVPQYEVRALNADGTDKWAVDIDDNPIHDVIPGTFNGDGTPDVAVHWGTPGDTLLRTRALSGVDGATIWDSTPVEAGAGRQPAGLAIGAFDSDGLDDVYYQALATRVLSGADGSELAASAAGPAYFMPLLWDVDGTVGDEVTLQGGFADARTLEADLSANIWLGVDNDQPLPYGAVAECMGDAILSEGSNVNRSRLKFTSLARASAGAFTTAVYAGGNRYDSEAQAELDGALLGKITSTAVHTNLIGTNEPTVLFGSSDGWLYAVDPCTSNLRWSYGFDAPVGSPTFGDTDGDGFDEVIVSVGDGYLYALKNAALLAPAFVLDIDPVAGVTDMDISSFRNDDQVSAKWAAVTGATSYEAAVIDQDGNVVVAWQDVGDVVEVTFMIAVQNGSSYRFGVRAKSAAGLSVDAVSDGAIANLSDVEDGDGTTEPPVGAGGCCDGSGSQPATWVLALAIGYMVIRRRRTQPPA